MKILNRKYSKYNPNNKIWKNGLYTASLILLIFILFEPFGFRDKEISLKILLYPGYAFIAFIYSYLNFQIVRQIIKKKQTWKIIDEIKNILLSIILITFAVHLFTYSISEDMPITLEWFFRLLYHVSSIFLIKNIIEFFYYNYKSTAINNKLLKSQNEISNQKLNDSEMQKKEIILISLEKEQIKISRNKIIFIQAASNYLIFYLREDDKKINKIIKRGRLHKIENDLSPFSEFVRCHRAFIINLNQSARLKGNMKNSRIIFQDVETEIPVSRTFYRTLKENLEKITLS
ncbi:MAG: LytTR family transcriptional regulator [Ignavibacteriae bacterium]|nr:LytTR family transcriptional regulator [Ignavibacteriota bacterium]